MSSAETTASHPRLRVRLFVASALAGGVLLVGFGWLIPSQFKSLPVSVLAEAGRGTPTLAAMARERLDAGSPGVAAIYAQAAAAVSTPSAAAINEEVDAYLAENTDLAVWGEVNPYLTNALPADASPAAGSKSGVIRQLLPATTRAGLSSYLAGSRHATTRAVLATAELPSYRQFLPVFSAGGAPLEATILLTALLVQSDELGSGAARELRALADEAGRTREAAKIEIIYLDRLALGRRFNWGQLAALTRGADSLDTLAKLRHLLQLKPESAPVLTAAAIASGRLDAVTDYVIRHGPLGLDALAFALYHGRGSLDLLLRQQVPPDGDLTVPPAESDRVAAALDPLVRLALYQPVLAVIVKFACYLLGGILFFLVAERLTALRQLELTPFITYLARGVGAIVICLLLVVINEPYLALGSQPSAFELRLVVPVLGTSSVATMTETSNAFPIDVATVVSITFFFMLQALVYLVCLLKLKEIESKPVPSLLKLRLAENEENLFDSGLYVGIAGTSAALVLQVLGIIEANLLAAYSSNLFGILCVAFVKIRHVRPFKQRLILEMAEASGAQTAPAG